MPEGPPKKLFITFPDSPEKYTISQRDDGGWSYTHHITKTRKRLSRPLGSLAECLQEISDQWEVEQ